MLQSVYLKCGSKVFVTLEEAILSIRIYYPLCRNEDYSSSKLLNFVIYWMFITENNIWKSTLL